MKLLFGCGDQRWISAFDVLVLLFLSRGPNPFNNHRVKPGHIRPEVLSYWECQGECGEDWYKEANMKWAIRPFEEMRLGHSK